MDELLEALITIKYECNKHSDCDTCPLRLDREEAAPTCAVIKDVPSEWKIKTPLWKAFDE